MQFTPTLEHLETRDTPSLVITTTQLADWTQNQPGYWQHIDVSDALPPLQYRWGNYYGSPIPGLSLNPTAGVLSGRPKAAGTYSFTIYATDGLHIFQARQSYTVTINPPPVILTTLLPNGSVGQSYAASLHFTGGTGPLQISAPGGMPPGLTLWGNIIFGTPTANGDYLMPIVITDGTAAQAWTVLEIRVGGVQPPF